MANAVIVGAGFSGQYAALILNNALKRTRGNHKVTVINRYPKFTYIPSLVWVGVGQLDVEKTQFELKPVYDRVGIEFVLGTAWEVHPDEQYVLADVDGTLTRVDYDYLIIATGPFLNYAATPGLGPVDGYTNSICTPPHARQTAQNYLALVERLKKGERANIVIGTGHGCCTCQGAGFEYLCLVHHDLVDRGVRDRVRLTWLSNEPRPGDFGIDGFETRRGPVTFTAEDMCGAIFEDYGIHAEFGNHVYRVDEHKIYAEDVRGEFKELEHDFAMLIPPFAGQPIQYLDKNGNDLQERMCNPAGFVKVDAVYGKSYDELSASDWPKTYQSPAYGNIFSCGIAFAPPGCMSKPCTSPRGTQFMPSIPRTGYTSEMTGKAAALNIVELIEGREPSHTASLAETPGMCVASMKNDWLSGRAATIGVQPIVRNRDAYPEYGRAMELGAVEVGLAGAWLKKGLHHAFLYKLQARPFWQYIP